ncbi:hypothetical protein COU80_04830 [Candidatus Peregrinibacteria bacterium CG10_big_fil_rev_8_21_14_0_10_55_24]|nr:MAG: hypothetical protein COU80_04830 [Candidatus Peregrinibacteria bacterium CG10_big_fil_rev_8_21_14_0_10_55_24]
MMVSRSGTSQTASSFSPVLGSLQQHAPFILDLSDQTPLSSATLNDQAQLQQYIETTFYPAYQWGVATYLEYRSSLLSRFPQMAAEKRYYHLGVDIIAPLHTNVHAPAAGSVFFSGYEEGEGNYGGLVVLQHRDASGTPYYSLYGHLDKERLPQEGEHIEQGALFARMGDLTCNGHWFFHTHVQLLTQKAIDEGWIHRGYCTKEQLSTLDAYCPSPLPFCSVRTEA